MAKKILKIRIQRDIEQAGYQFKINDLNETIYVRYAEEEWEEMSEPTEARIRLHMRNIGYGGRNRPGLNDLKDTILVMADDNRYNPIKNYFASLDGKYTPNADKTPYLIPQFAKYVDNPDKMFGRWLYRWMVGAIAKFDRGERNPMLVWVGPQTIGKSILVKWLCPISDEYYNQTELAYASKDKLLEMTELMLMEIEELDATTAKATIGTLKALITKQFVRVRPPYGKRPVRKNVPVSFIGTVNPNEAGFLNDPSGLTRFLTTEITKIDFDYEKMSRDGLWSEAYWFYTNTERAWALTAEEVAKQTELNSRFEQISPLLDFIEAHFNITKDEADFVTSQQIRGIAVNKGYRIYNERAFDMELGAVMTKLGLKRIRRRLKDGDDKQPRGYCGMSL